MRDSEEIIRTAGRKFVAFGMSGIRGAGEMWGLDREAGVREQRTGNREQKSRDRGIKETVTRRTGVCPSEMLAGMGSGLASLWAARRLGARGEQWLGAGMTESNPVSRYLRTGESYDCPRGCQILKRIGFDLFIADNEQIGVQAAFFEGDRLRTGEWICRDLWRSNALSMTATVVNL